MMKFKILNTQNKIESRIPTYIQYWYDRHTRSYIVQLLEEYNISIDKILT